MGSLKYLKRLRGNKGLHIFVRWRDGMAAIKRANRQFLSFNVKMLKLLGLWGSDGEVDDGKNKWTDLRNYYALPLFLPSVVPIVYDLVLLTTG